MSTPNEGAPRPQVSIVGIDKLGMATKKKVVDDEVVVVTRFAFEGEISADQVRTLHSLLKKGGSLTASFYSPQLMMDLQVKEAEKKAQET